MTDTGIIYSIAYQRLTFHQPQAAARLLNTAGSAQCIYENRDNIHDISHEASSALHSLISADWGKALQRAEAELAWCEKNRISILTPDMESFPQRLLTCLDCPTVIYYRGTAAINAPHVISIVGTRKSTAYGHDFINRLVSELHELLPDTIIVSGLAYGIDVCAHRAALAAGTDTIGVLAHGLDTMYPASHRSVAAEMLRHGGLLTEYMSATPGERQNFLRRNRIVAGMADCTIVVESMAHGGSLVTAGIALDYGREVMALPGNISSKTSEGCNRIIRSHKATLITSAQDVIDTMGWQSARVKDEQRTRGIQTQMFHDLTPEQQMIMEQLQQTDMQINTISRNTQIPIGKITAVLFEMEMKGLVKALAGGMYHLIK